MNVPLRNGEARLEYIEAGSIFCWNSSMCTVTLCVPSTRLVLSSGSRSTYLGTVAPSSGVCGTITDGCTFELTCSGSSLPTQPSTAKPASPTDAVRASSSRIHRVLSHVLIASSLMNGQCTWPKLRLCYRTEDGKLRYSYSRRFSRDASRVQIE